MANFFVQLINYCISGAGAAILWVINLLPDSPWADPTSPPGSINLGYITWLLPFPTIIAHYAIFLGAIGIYYVIRVAARWVKVARS